MTSWTVISFILVAILVIEGGYMIFTGNGILGVADDYSSKASPKVILYRRILGGLLVVGGLFLLLWRIQEQYFPTMLKLVYISWAGMGVVIVIGLIFYLLISRENKKTGNPNDTF